MLTHLKILTGLLIAGGVIGIGAALFSHAAFHALGALIALRQPADAEAARTVLDSLGWLFATLLGVAAAVSLACGWGLLRRRRWARVTGVVLAAGVLAFYPLGTLAGVYALWVLLSRRTEALFTVDGPPAS
jgi:hypothetical protein